ncbi:hypothetical protein K432DRAFT_428266 [Lepidopterella palustris CBS 459.81]|uniref:Uncharacterized protein n=1 Tax=Lepidopterella palustris CBS 459.81 TaxID=1314670 RepID=A0A8E2JCM0_9PEZI|nr:hypothetical protein K432DRAFT_428266 [Lepidopterella palustris CBS 459.81]
MDPSLRNTANLTAHISKLRNNLISRFENAIASASLSDAFSSYSSSLTDRPPSNANPYTSTSYTILHMGDEAAALIRATEDLLVLTRQMQELWLGGGLKTLTVKGEGSEGKEGERGIGVEAGGVSRADVVRVAEMVERWVGRGEVDEKGAGKG